MARAGFCSTCQENVYLDPDGSCPKGHGAGCVTNAYDVPDAPTAQAQAAPAAYPGQVARPKKKRTGLIVAVVIVALLLLCGCGIGAVLLISAGSSEGGSTEKSKPTPDLVQEKAKTKAAWALMKGMLQGDAELIKSVVPAETLAALPPETWTSFAEGTKREGVTYKSEMWTGAVLTVLTESATSRATVTVTPSKPDASSVEIRSVAEGSEPATLTMEVFDEKGSWKVSRMVSSEGALRFDKAGFLEDAGLSP